MGVLDIILGRDEQGNASKVNMALIALLLWRWYQSTQQGGGAQPIPSPSPRDQAPVPDAPTTRIPTGAPSQIPSPSRGGDGDSDFGPLVESTKRMPDFQRGGGGRRGPMEDDDGGGMGGGGLGDILGDILRGGQGGPGRGPAGGPGGGGLGDILGDILGGGRGMPGDAGGGRGPAGGGMGGGGLGDILGQVLGGGRGMPTARFSGSQGDPLGGLGGLLAGGAAGGVLGDLLQQFDQSGQGEAARSWVSSGENVPVSPNDIENTFGSDIINQLADQFGMDKGELLQGLSQTLPGVVDQLTPDGRLPTAEDISRWK